MTIDEFRERARLYEKRHFLAQQLAEKDALIAEQNKKLAHLEAELEWQQTIESIKQQVVGG